jgi:hypothetical protein
MGILFVALCSIGPILAVMALGVCPTNSTVQTRLLLFCQN